MTGKTMKTSSEMVPRAQLYQLSYEKWKYPLCFVVSCVQPITQHYESRTVRKAPLQTVTMKNMDDFRYEWKPPCAIAKSTLFAVSKDEWGAKEDTGESMKNKLYILRYAKTHPSG